MTSIRVRLALLIAAFCPLGGMAASADHQPVIVVPGRFDVPVIIDGFDATGAVVEGDWGLHRPGAAVNIFAPGPLLMPRARAGYFPATGRRPRAGRHEVLGPRRKLPRAQSYHRSWLAGSEPAFAATLPSSAPGLEASGPGPFGLEAPRRRHPNRPMRRHR